LKNVYQQAGKVDVERVFEPSFVARDSIGPAG
jgi:hypothetical protein